MCKRNGLDMTWNEFSNLQGSIICVDINNGDLGGFVAGANDDFVLTISGNVTNTTYGGWTAAGARATGTNQVTAWNFYVVAVMGGKMIAADNRLDILYGIPAQSVMSGPSPVLPHNTTSIEGQKLEGFHRDFRKGFRQGFGVTSRLIEFEVTASTALDL